MSDKKGNRYNKSKQDTIKDIKHNYEQVEKFFVEQLYMKHSLHGTTIGSAREDIWKQLFEMIIPKKFVIEQSVFIIDSSFKNDDSQTGISREVDLAIIDETYTPYIFKFGRTKFVPIEAVAVVVECKSKSSGKSLESWINSINALKSSDLGIARMVSFMQYKQDKDDNTSDKKNVTQTSTRPLKIFCGLEGRSINKKLKNCFDFTILANKDNNSLNISHRDLESLEQWAIYLNNPNFDIKLPVYSLTEHFSVYELDKNGNKTINTLLTFNFQLNQLLMLINNPLLFPHLAYVNMFNKKVKEGGITNAK